MKKCEKSISAELFKNRTDTLKNIEKLFVIFSRIFEKKKNRKKNTKKKKL